MAASELERAFAFIDVARGRTAASRSEAEAAPQRVQATAPPPPADPAPAVAARVDAVNRALLLQGAHASAPAPVSAEEEEEDEVLADMEQLVGALRAGGEALHERLVADNAVLEATRDAVDANMGSISGANKKLEAENRASLLSLCGVFAMLAWVATLFAGSYVAMKVLRKPPRHAFASSKVATAVSASVTVSASLLPTRQQAQELPLPSPTALVLEERVVEPSTAPARAPEEPASIPAQYLAPEAVAPVVSETPSLFIAHDGDTSLPEAGAEEEGAAPRREPVAEVQSHMLGDTGTGSPASPVPEEEGSATEEAEAAAGGHAEPPPPSPEPTQSAEVRAYYAQQAAYAKMQQKQQEAQVQADGGAE